MKKKHFIILLFAFLIFVITMLPMNFRRNKECLRGVVYIYHKRMIDGVDFDFNDCLEDMNAVLCSKDENLSSKKNMRKLYHNLDCNIKEDDWYVIIENRFHSGAALLYDNSIIDIDNIATRLQNKNYDCYFIDISWEDTKQ